MQPIDQHKQRPTVQFYAHILTGHIIPILKIIQILQKKSPHLDISFVTGPLIIRKFQKIYPHIHMVSVQDELDQNAEQIILAEKHLQFLNSLMTYMQKYFQNKTNKPDLIFADFFMLQAFNYANKNGIKFIVNNPNSYTTMSGVYNVLNFDRSIRVEGYTIFYSIPDHPLWNLFDLLLNAYRYKAQVLFNSFIGLDDPALLPSNHSLVGLIPNSTIFPEQMGSQLIEWMNGWRKKGNSKFFYISFGSMIQLSEEFTKKVVRVIQKLQYPTIWSLRSPNAHLIQSELIYHREWLPQQLILQQEDVRGYLTHCGWGSICEAIANSTPMVCIPVCADQGWNAKLVHKRHIGITIYQFQDNEYPQLFEVPVEEQTIFNAIRDVMEDASYSQSMKRMSRLSKTHDTAQIISTLVERMLQFGSEYLMSPAYESSTIKDNSVLLRDILVQKYSKLLDKKRNDCI